MTDLPDPPVPACCDLRAFHYLPLDVVRLRDSELAATASGDEFRAAVLLWCASWHQVPASSLPTDDRALAHLAGYGRDCKGWAKVRCGALHGWYKASDGRLYHKVLGPKAAEAWGSRVAQRARTESARAARAASRREHAHSVTSSVTENVTSSVTENVTGSKGEGEGEGREREGNRLREPQPGVVTQCAGENPGAGAGAGADDSIDDAMQAVEDATQAQRDRMPPPQVRSLADWLVMHPRAFTRDDRAEWAAAYAMAGWDLMSEVYDDVVAAEKDRRRPVFLRQITERIDFAAPAEETA